MNRTVLSVVAALGLSAGLAVGQAFGQAPGQASKKPANLPVQPTASPAAPSANPTMQPSSATSSQPLISVDFPGGTVAEYIIALKRSSPDTPINIVASDRAAKQVLTAICLKNVVVSVAVYSIQAASTSPKMVWRVEQIVQPFQQVDDPESASKAFRVECVSAGQGYNLVVQAFSLQPILGSGGIKGAEASSTVALTAIETGLKLQDPENSDGVELKFHADSGLLFVRGTKEEVQLVSQIVARLREDSEGRREATERLEREEILRELALKDAELALKLRYLERDVARRAIAEVQKRADAGGASARELDEAFFAVDRADIAVEQALLNQERAKIAVPSQSPKPEAADPADNSKAIKLLESENAALRRSLLETQAVLKKQSVSPSNQSPK